MAVVNPDKYHVTEILTLETNNIQLQPEKDEISAGFNHCKAAGLTAFALHRCCWCKEGPFPFPAMMDTF